MNDSPNPTTDDEIASLIQAQDALLAERLALNAEIERLRHALSVADWDMAFAQWGTSHPARLRIAKVLSNDE